MNVYIYICQAVWQQKMSLNLNSGVPMSKNFMACLNKDLKK